MNNNDLKKAYLQSYIPSINAAKRIEEEIEQLRLDKMMPSVIMDDMPHAHNKTDLSDYMAKLDELINKLIAARYKRIDLSSIRNMERKQLFYRLRRERQQQR